MPLGQNGKQGKIGAGRGAATSHGPGGVGVVHRQRGGTVESKWAPGDPTWSVGIISRPLAPSPLYGFGTLKQAFNFVSRLNRTPERIICSTAALTDAEAQELRLEDNAEALSLTLALAEKDSATPWSTRG
jgi:hypothetical protein